MKKLLNIAKRKHLTSMGFLVLLFIYFLVHCLAFYFKYYSVLPVFYGVLFLAIAVHVMLSYLNSEP